VVLVGALAFYKYSTFLVADVGAGVLGALGSALEADARGWRSPIPPLAISFFTFEFVHYLYEIRRHGRAPIRNPAHFAVFALFFPTLASGPIKRFPDFAPQLDALARPRATDAWAGARRIVLGLFKKVCIADLLVEPITALEQVPSATGPGLALLAVLQGFRIYYDFAGYTDIALGLSGMLNLRVPENFDRPYLSTSIQDFWRRWHMSLSTWIRDYVYIPLGGNRGRRALHLVTAMALCGLWHGAAWNFVAWGAYHGAGLAGEAALRSRWPAAFEAGRVRSLARWAVCYSFVTYGWLLFFYPLADVIRMTGEALRWTIGT
jgi:alginate O-acetyltransferase complex protein AlgI